MDVGSPPAKNDPPDFASAPRILDRSCRMSTTPLLSSLNHYFLPLLLLFNTYHHVRNRRHPTPRHVPRKGPPNPLTTPTPTTPLSTNPQILGPPLPPQNRPHNNTPPKNPLHPLRNRLLPLCPNLLHAPNLHNPLLDLPLPITRPSPPLHRNRYQFTSEHNCGY